MDVLNDPLVRKVVFPVALAAIFIIYLIIRGIFNLLFGAPNNPGAAADVPKNSNQPMSPGESIGSISVRLGEDIRDVWSMGYSDEQINGVLTGNYSLAELYKMAPEGNTRTLKGQEIIAKRGQRI